jgi:hypothetical protein
MMAAYRSWADFCMFMSSPLDNRDRQPRVPSIEEGLKSSGVQMGCLNYLSVLSRLLSFWPPQVTSGIGLIPPPIMVKPKPDFSGP